MRQRSSKLLHGLGKEMSLHTGLDLTWQKWHPLKIKLRSLRSFRESILRFKLHFSEIWSVSFDTCTICVQASQFHKLSGEKKTASPNPSHCGPYEVSRQVKDVMSTVSVSGRFMPFMMFAVQSVFATCSVQFVLRHYSLPMSHVVCVIKCVCPVSGMHGEGRYEWPDGRAYEGMLWQFIQSFKLWNILTKTHIKWGSNYFSPCFAHYARKPY